MCHQWKQPQFTFSHSILGTLRFSAVFSVLFQMPPAWHWFLHLSMKRYASYFKFIIAPICYLCISFEMFHNLFSGGAKGIAAWSSKVWDIQQTETIAPWRMVFESWVLSTNMLASALTWHWKTYPATWWGKILRPSLCDDVSARV